MKLMKAKRGCSLLCGANSSKATSNALKFNGIRSFQDVLHVSEQKLDEIFAKSKLFGLPKSAGRVVKHTVGDLCRHTLRLSTDIEYTKNSRKPSDLICSLKFNDPSSAITQEKREQELKTRTHEQRKSKHYEPQSKQNLPKSR